MFFFKFIRHKFLFGLWFSSQISQIVCQDYQQSHFEINFSDRREGLASLECLCSTLQSGLVLNFIECDLCMAGGTVLAYAR